ncbi:hypothetical protein SEA_LEWAN_141 [Mycobacterium phage Lewan]|nr:hypothetical protein SEA_LEWAN_141 [Mycobacterium phage Lewan]
MPRVPHVRLPQGQASALARSPGANRPVARFG